MKLNIETAEIEGITRTSQNLKFYEEKYEDKFSGNTRLFHIQFVGTDGNTYYASYYVERVNFRTINLVCQHSYAGKRQTKCTARITLTHNLSFR